MADTPAVPGATDGPGEPSAHPQTLVHYLNDGLARVKSGDTGLLPVLGGLALLAIVFQSLNANFHTAGNLVNLGVQGSIYMLFSLGMIFVLLIGEIDLSIGFIGGVAGVIMAELVFPSFGWPWYAALGAGLAARRRSHRRHHHRDRTSILRCYSGRASGLEWGDAHHSGQWRYRPDQRRHHQ